MSLDGRGGSMTSWTYMTHIFVFVFLTAIGLSKEGCLDHLDITSWSKNLGNLKKTFTVMTTEDPKDTVKCTLEAECLQKNDGIGCQLRDHCPSSKPRPHLNMLSPECKGNISQVHIYHFMCLMAKAFEHPLEGCEYNDVCKIYPQIAYTPSDLTTTPTTTTPLTTTPPETTTTTTTVLPSTTTTVLPSPTTTVLPSPTTTVLPSPTTITTLTTATKLAPESSVAKLGNNETLLKEPQKETDKLKVFLGLSLVLNVIVPLAVFLYMRHRWMRDRMPSNLTHVSNGNLTGDPPKKEADAPPAFPDAKDAESTPLSMNA